MLFEDGKYWMFAAEMANHCGLGQWTTNSQVVAAVSDTPLGPFVRQGVSIPPWSHNPEAIRTPDGQYVIYTLGPGFGLKKEQNCTKGATVNDDLNPTCPTPRQDTDFEGNDLPPACGLRASSAEECCSHCLDHPKCSSYTYMPTAHNCCLKTAGAAGARHIRSYQSAVVRPPPPTTVNFTVHSSSSPHGPWTATTMSVPGWNNSWTLQNPGNWNPAPVVLPDGSVRVMAHTDWAPWSGEVILEAPHWQGPYRVVGGDLIDHCFYCEEDPFMWVDKRGNWHVLYHRMFDPAGTLDPNWGQEDGSWRRPRSPVPTPGWAGGHAFSRDGLSWSPWTRCYNTSVLLENGQTVETRRRERPKLLFNADGHPTHLYNGAIWPGETYTIVAPLNVKRNG